MNWTLKRTSCTPFGIFSDLISEEGHRFVTAEHSYDGQPKLGVGTYTCSFGSHMLHSGPVQTYEVLGVPGHTGILFHVGNYPQNDSDGCLLLGREQQGQMILKSRDAWTEFLLLNAGVPFELQVLA